MELRDRHFGRIASAEPTHGEIEVDVGSIIRRLLLFEHCILESIQLKEMPALLRAFGYDGVMTLLACSDFEIVCDAMTVGNVGQVDFLADSRARGGPLPLGSYRLECLVAGERDKYLHIALQEVHKAPGLSLKQAKQLKLELVARVHTYPNAAGIAGVDNCRRELEREDPIFLRALSLIMNQAGIDPGPGLEFHVEDLGNEGDYFVATNLSSFGLSEEAAHQIVERALLGVAGLEQRLELMRAFQAVTGFRDQELPIFQEKLTFLWSQLDPDAQEQRLNRIVEIGDLPSLEDLPEGQHVDVEKLLKLRSSEECRELRRWLREVDRATDAEIAKQFRSIRERAASLMHTRVGGTVRFLIESAAGVTPGAGIAVGPALSAADKYIIDKLIGRPGPASFLGRKYRSLFSE